MFCYSFFIALPIFVKIALHFLGYFIAPFQLRLMQGKKFSENRHHIILAIMCDTYFKWGESKILVKNLCENQIGISQLLTISSLAHGNNLRISGLIWYQVLFSLKVARMLPTNFSSVMPISNLCNIRECHLTVTTQHYDMVKLIKLFNFRDIFVMLRKCVHLSCIRYVFSAYNNIGTIQGSHNVKMHSAKMTKC